MPHAVIDPLGLGPDKAKRYSGPLPDDAPVVAMLVRAALSPLLWAVREELQTSYCRVLHVRDAIRFKPVFRHFSDCSAAMVSLTRRSAATRSSFGV